MCVPGSPFGTRCLSENHRSSRLRRIGNGWLILLLKKDLKLDDPILSRSPPGSEDHFGKKLGKNVSVRDLTMPSPVWLTTRRGAEGSAGRAERLRGDDVEAASARVFVPGSEDHGARTS
jgi:hypothetical protein